MSIDSLTHIKMILTVVHFATCLSVSAQSVQDVQQREWHKNDMVHAYVYCNGERVDALYNIFSCDQKLLGLGPYDYSATAIDTTLAGVVVVPQYVTLSDGTTFQVTHVSRHAFADCRHVTQVVLPASITDIGDQSFMNCRSLSTIVLPASVRQIWPYAFRGCARLMRIVMRGATPPDAYNDIFDDRTLRHATLVVPAAYAEKYRNAFVWNMFRYCVADWDR